MELLSRDVLSGVHLPDAMLVYLGVFARSYVAPAIFVGLAVLFAIWVLTKLGAGGGGGGS